MGTDKISPDYVSDLGEALLKWSEKRTSMFFTGFLRERGLGFGYFSKLCVQFPRLNNIFEYILAVLATRLKLLIMSQEKLTQLQGKVCYKYLSVYDQQLKEVEHGARPKSSPNPPAMSEEEAYEVEEFSEDELTDEEKDLFQSKTDD